MSDYFFQQPDEEEKREYLRMEAERIRRQMDINGLQKLPTPPSQNISPRLDGPTPINGLNSPDLGPMPEGQPDPLSSYKNFMQQNGALSTALDFMPLVGDAKGFLEAEGPLDYVFATAGLVPGFGDAAKQAYKMKKIADAQKRYDNTQADTLTPGHRAIQDPGHSVVRERMGDDFLDANLPEYIDEIDPSSYAEMSPEFRRLWKALERDDYLGFDRTDDLMQALSDADIDELVDNFDLSPQLKSALGRYINGQYR
jgi:hypothetical protein